MALWNHTTGNFSSGELDFLHSDASTASSVPSKVFKIVPLALIMLASIIANAILVYAVYADVRMQTATNILIASQGVADFGTSVLVIPFALVSVAADAWIFGEKVCIVNAFFNLFFAQATVLQMSVIAFERYLVIVKPLFREITLFNAVRMAAFAWGVSFFGAFPWLYLTTDHATVVYFPGFYVCGKRYNRPLGGLAQFSVTFTILTFAILPLLFISHCYYQIGKVIRRKNQSVCPMALSNAQKLAINVYASSALTSKIVIGTTLVQVFPACFLMLLNGLQVGYIPVGLQTGLKWIMWCHCIVKPIVYASKSRAWGETIRNYLGKFSLCSASFRTKVRSMFVVLEHTNQNRLAKRDKKYSSADAMEPNKKEMNNEEMVKRYISLCTAKQAWLGTNNELEAEEFSTF